MPGVMRPARQPHAAVAVQQQVVIGRSDVDAGASGLPPWPDESPEGDRPARGSRGGRFGPRGKMHDHEDRGLQVPRQARHDLPQRLDSAGRSADDDDVVPVHAPAILRLSRPVGGGAVDRPGGGSRRPAGCPQASTVRRTASREGKPGGGVRRASEPGTIRPISLPSRGRPIKPSRTREWLRRHRGCSSSWPSG